MRRAQTVLVLAGLCASSNAWAAFASGSLGAGISWTFGGQRHLGGWLELGANAHPLLRYLPAPVTPEVGAFARVAWTRGGAPTLIGGARLGIGAPLDYDLCAGTYIPGLSLDGEAGVALRPRGPDGFWVGGLAAVPGVTGHIGRVFSPRAAMQPALALPRPNRVARGPETTLDLGVFVDEGWFPSRFCVSGRPLRDGGRVVRPCAWVSAGCDAERTEDGRDEYAAVLAFRRLAVELAAVGAPQSLVGRSLAAAREEAGHAAMCFALSARDSEGTVAVSPIACTVRGGTRAERLARLYVESVVDGELNEGRAAEDAAAEASSSPDCDVIVVQERIAVEERGHAALARDIARWCALEA